MIQRAGIESTLLAVILSQLLGRVCQGGKLQFACQEWIFINILFMCNIKNN